MMTMRGEMGYDLVLSAPVWGFNDVYFRRQDLQVKRDFGEHVMENVLFKVAYPAEFHAQTAIEAAMRLHPQVVYRVDEVHQIAIQARSIHWSPYDRVGVVNAVELHPDIALYGTTLRRREARCGAWTRRGR
jgi:2-methylcitrate dehydratase